MWLYRIDGFEWFSVPALEPGLVYIAQIFEFGLSTVVLGLLFVLIFRFMPDMKIKWSSVWLGGFMTSILFNLGKILLSFYFGAANPNSAYGAAGSVVLILLWVSYSCLILFFGAAFTRIYTEKYEAEIHPQDFAMKVETEEVIVEKGANNPPEEEEKK
ncbi:YihY/virulence factor BrkB family protein [Algoriphagus boritolerans]|uniref:YihY/virulence factor BrkB family protein n=1 Tax=Algoriphagus boritolerans TaxID=308111 RepID=UPI000AF7C90C